MYVMFDEFFFIARKKMKVDSNVRNVWIQIGILNNFFGLYDDFKID